MVSKGCAQKLLQATSYSILRMVVLMGEDPGRREQELMSG